MLQRNAKAASQTTPAQCQDKYPKREVDAAKPTSCTRSGNLHLSLRQHLLNSTMLGHKPHHVSMPNAGTRTHSDSFLILRRTR